jgi:ketosteroid isomerase-like protein
MSQENLDLVLRAMHAALAQPKPDFETVNALFHPDHVLVPIEASTFGGAEAQGAGGYKAWLEQTADEMEWEAELKGAVDVGPHKVLVVTLNRFRGASSGAETEDRVWNVVTVTDRKLTRTEAYLDPAKALEAAGLSE